MEITVFFSSKEHPVYPHLLRWQKKESDSHNIHLTNKITEIQNGDILFLIACGEIVKNDVRSGFKKTLCVHESDLPKGRGWSPVVYSILKNERKIFMTLFEAGDKIDSGDIWKKIFFEIDEHELADEINQKVSLKTIELMNFAINDFDSIKPVTQNSNNATYLQRRTPEDSELDVKKSIAEQFNLFRIANENRYPCFFYYKGHRYKLSIKKF